MLTMSQVNDIRDLSRGGYSISKISHITGVDRKTIRKYLQQDDFSPDPPIAKARISIVTPYIDIIRAWLEEDQKHWSKQRISSDDYQVIRSESRYTISWMYEVIKQICKQEK